MMIKKYTLYNGINIPEIICGTWTYDNEKAYIAVMDALEVGYRAFDTASYYENESGVGKAVRESGLPRKELFVQSKVWRTEVGYTRAKQSIEASLDKLGLDYIDLMLIHWPQVKMESDRWKENNASTWQAFEELYRKGIIKAIGISNFFIVHLEELIKRAEIAPMVNQIELHPGFFRRDVIDYCNTHSILVQAWSPFGRGEAFQNDALIDIAHYHQKSINTIILQWIRQKGAIPIIKARKKEHLVSNMDLDGIILTSEEIEIIDNIPFFGRLGYDPDSIRFDEDHTKDMSFTATNIRKEAALK